jgi:DNA-binding NarL/FixJ family response regulator
MTASVIALPRPGSTLLNDTDRAILRMLALGLDSVDVARRYHLGHAFAAERVRSLLAKTGTDDLDQLVVTALRSGWIGAQDAYGAAA